MANQCEAESTRDLRKLAGGAIVTRTKIYQLLCVCAAAVFLFVGSARAQCPTTSPCILVSNFGTGTHSSLRQVEVYSDDGKTVETPGLLSGCPSTNCPVGAGGGEGIVGLSGSSNVMYVANSGAYINAFDLAGVWKGGLDVTGNVAGMVANASGTTIYAGQYNWGNVLSLAPLDAAPFLMLTATTPAPPPPPLLPPDDAHDVVIGTYPPSLAGDVFTSYFPNLNSGVNQFSSTDPGSALSFQGGSLPRPPNNCATFSGRRHCWTNLTGMVFDAAGNLWVNSAFQSRNVPPLPEDSGTFEFSPTGSMPPDFVPVNFTPVPLAAGGSAADPVGVTIAPAGDPFCPNCIIIANFSKGTVSMINPGVNDANCTGTVSSPGTCDTSLFFTPGGNPKYVVYSQSFPNPDNNGYIEVCKQSNPSHPVTGIFDFMVKAPLFSSGTVEVPVGECSGSIQVPSGTVTITETPVIGVAVSNVTATSYNQDGFPVNELISWTAPDLNATVTVVPGDVALETLATFTNYAAPPGQLKICKIAGAGVEVGTPFTFTTTVGRTINKYTIEAGPADQGGFCELAGTFPVNTQVTVAETVPGGIIPKITVAPPGRGSDLTFNSVVATIFDGITEVDFTNTHQF